MARPARLALTICLVVVAGFNAHGQQFRARYIEDIAHLQMQGRRSADLGIAKATITGETSPVTRTEELLFEGRDDAGQPWSARLPISPGFSGTDVWRADFDRNGRDDLLIAAFLPDNGRCILHLTATFLMIDRGGRPVPWVLETHASEDGGYGEMSVALVDLNRNGRAEAIAASCEAEISSLVEDRAVTGIYEARDAHWQPVGSPDLRGYARVFRRKYSAAKLAVLQPLDPSRWIDASNSPLTSPPLLYLTGILLPDPECRNRGVDIPLVYDSRGLASVAEVENDPCEEAGEYRLKLSDGSVCRGWPTVVIDGTGGREIVDSRSNRIEAALRRVAEKHMRVVLTGRTMPARCSPTMLWASDAQ